MFYSWHGNMYGISKWTILLEILDPERDPDFHRNLIDCFLRLTPPQI